MQTLHLPANNPRGGCSMKGRVATGCWARPAVDLRGQLHGARLPLPAPSPSSRLLLPVCCGFRFTSNTPENSVSPPPPAAGIMAGAIGWTTYMSTRALCACSYDDSAPRSQGNPTPLPPPPPSFPKRRFPLPALPTVTSPDVTMPFTDQGRHPIRDSKLLESKGKAWLDSHKKHVATDISQIGILNRYERKY